MSKLVQLKKGGEIRVKLEKLGGGINHANYQLGQKAKGFTTWMRPVAKGADDGVAWMAANADKFVLQEGKKMIDLLALDYDQLPPGWQANNDDAAKFAVELVCKFLLWTDGNVTEEHIKIMGRLIHNNWTRQQIDWAQEEIGAWPSMFAEKKDVDYCLLSEDEQAKDDDIIRVILKQALTLLASE